VRIFQRWNGTRHRSGIKITSGMKWALDHIKALCNGGKNIESNLAPILVGKVHDEKTAIDVAIKAKTAAMAKAAAGIRAKKVKIPSPPKPVKERRFDRAALIPRALYQDTEQP
jgi:5-methylcytosine-specific restriction protein A